MSLGLVKKHDQQYDLSERPKSSVLPSWCPPIPAQTEAVASVAPKPSDGRGLMTAFGDVAVTAVQVPSVRNSSGRLAQTGMRDVNICRSWK